MKLSRIIIITVIIALFILPLLLRMNRRVQLANNVNDTIENIYPKAQVISPAPSVTSFDSSYKTNYSKEVVTGNQNNSENKNNLSLNDKNNKRGTLIFTSAFSLLLVILLLYWLIKRSRSSNYGKYKYEDNKSSTSSNKPMSSDKYSSKTIEAGMDFLNSDNLRQEVERAKKARDQANREEWERKGSQGLGQTHSCHICKCITYGEETVIRLQKGALAQNNIFESQRIERQSGYRCKSCGKEYCKECLEKKAPGNAYGGKSCPGCNGLFEIIHG